jgi:hypothetical protein
MMNKTRAHKHQQSERDAAIIVPRMARCSDETMLAE